MAAGLAATSDTLALRRAGRPLSWLSVPVVSPEGVALPSGRRPRIYLAPLDARIDERILIASLRAAGVQEPAWVQGGRSRTRSDDLCAAFLAGEPVLLPLATRRGGPDYLARLLSWALSEGVDADLIPIEALWGPANKAPSAWNLILGNPYDPPPWARCVQVLRRDRVRVVTGAPGTLAQLEHDAAARDPIDLAGFVRSQAVKALSKAERAVLGDRYKVPRFASEQILADTEFQNRVATAGAQAGLTRAEALRQAEGGLRELATGHNFFYISLLGRFAHWLYTRVYAEEISVDPEQIERLRRLGREAALVFIPSHKSHFDHLVLYWLLYSSGFPTPHTAAGNNLRFFPLSRILPKTGAYFIRRSAGDDPVYRETLRAFIHYLVQRHFHQEFFIEGGRSRSGKLLPPRFGMLRYLAEAVRRSGVRDVYVVPTAITYDQLFEVGDYVREQLGEEKRRESLLFLVKSIWALRRQRLGQVRIRFAEPIPVRDHLDQAGDDQLALERLAFRISAQINAVTELTPVSVVCSALVGGSSGRALSWDELESQAQRILDHAGKRALLSSSDLGRSGRRVVDRGLESLEPTRTVESYTEGIEPVYWISARWRHAAGYYRNTILHFFLVRAISALALAASSEPAEIEGWALRIRELLKFEFFFEPRAEFLEEVRAELSEIAREAESDRAPFTAAGPRILLEFLESYLVVMETLISCAGVREGMSEAALLERAQAVGRQFLRQGRVHSPELLSNLNFHNALQLAVNLGAAKPAPGGYQLADPATLRQLATDLEFLGQRARS